jgi:serine/threonine protein kinase/Flp pilus assembly protein TadD
MDAQPDSAARIFDAAVDLGTPAERAAYLDAACGQDLQLRAEVEELLRHDDAVGSFLDLSAPSDPQATTDERPVSERPGTVIGPYKLLEQIGEGGFGVVFMAEQTQPVRRKVALKVLKPGMDTRQVVARFEAERQALAIMDHPNIAKVFDGGATSAGRPYFVMELVKGVPITEFCDQHHLTPRQRLELFVPVCQAVQHAHQKGIIHRDLKPSNVLVTRYDSRPVPKVIDFGVAKAAGQPLTEHTLVTGFGAVVGTLEYMSPEQAELNQLDIDTRSDIYSLGVLLYELLTGTTPLEKKRLKEAAVLEVLRLIREEEPPRPSTKLSTAEGLPTLAANRGTEPRRLTALLRGELDWIVMKALEKDRNRRYDTANGLGMDLQRHLADEPVQACPPSAGYRLRKLVRRNRRALVTAAVLAVALLAAVGGVAWSVGWANRDRAARQAAVEQEARLALDEAERSRQQGKWPEALSAAKRAEGLLAGGDSTALRARIHRLVGELHRDIQMLQRLEGARLRPDSPKDGKVFDWDATDAEYLKAFRDYGIDVEALPAERAAELIRARPIRLELTRALDQWAWGMPRRKDRLLPVVRAADPDAWRNRVRDALWAGQRSQALLGELAASDQVRTLAPETLCALGNALRQAGLADDAVALLRDAQLRHPDDFWLNYELASALAAARRPRWEEVARFSSAALALRPRSTAALLSLGSALSQQGRPDQAIGYYRKLVEIDPKDGAAQNNLAVALEKVGQPDDAMARYQKAVELQPNNALLLTNLGWAIQRKGLADKAITHFQRAIAANPNYARAHFGLGTALRAKGQLDEAITSFRKASDLDPEFVGALRTLAETLQKVTELKPGDPQNHFGLGNTLAQLGRWHEAAAAYDRGLALNPASFLYWYNAALLHAVVGDVDGYRRTCRGMLQRFGGTDDPLIAENTAKACLLLCDAVSAADSSRVQQLAELAVTDTETHWAHRYFMRSRGLAEHRAGRYAKAVEWLERFTPSANGLHEDASVFAILSMAQHGLGRVKEAEAALASARAILEKMPDPAKGRPFLSDWRAPVTGWFLCRVAEDDMLIETLKRRMARLGADHPDTLHAMTDLAGRYARLGRHADAVKLYAEALKRRKARGEAGHPDTLNTMVNLGNLYAQLRRDADAVKLYEETLKQRRAQAADEDHLVGSILALAGCYTRLDRHADALKLYEEALARRKAKLGPDHVNTVWCLRPIAQSLVKLDRGAEAVPLIDEFVGRLSGKIAWGYISEMLWLRLRHFEKTKDAAGCRASAEMWEEQSQTIARLDIDFLYDAARCRAITAAVLRATDQSERAAAAEADRAMPWLKKAVAAGYTDAEQLKKDPDLSALRGRADFRKLVAEREHALQIKQARSLYERGTALHRQGKLDEALASFRKAVVLDPQCSDVVNEAFARRGRLEELRSLWEKGLESNPPHHGAWCGYAELCLYLGNEYAYRRNRKALLERFGKTTDLVVAERAGRACLLLPASGDELRQAAALTERAVAAGAAYGLYGHFELANGLAKYRQDRLQQALPLLEDSVGRLGPSISGLVLAMTQYRTGHKKEARQTLAAAIAAVDWGEARACHVGAWISHVLRREAEAQIVPQLSAFLKGEHQPRDNAERLVLISACQYRKYHACAARLHADLFAAEPKLAGDLRAGRRYNAACAAALAGDANRKTGKVSDEERAFWRKQAREWLRADLAAYAKLRDGGRDDDRLWIRQRLCHWLRTDDLAGLRDREALARLPAGEQAACRRIWAEVTALYGRTILPGSPLDYSSFEVACLRWLGGDARGYEQLRTQLIEWAGRQGENSTDAYFAARTCLVPPKGSPDPELAVRWAERVVRIHGKSAWNLHTLGFAHLRARQWKESIRRCRESLEAQPGWGARMLNWLVLAMAHQRLGQAEEARLWLTLATQWREALADPQAIDLTDWLEFQLLLPEARDLVQGPAAKK